MCENPFHNSSLSHRGVYCDNRNHSHDTWQPCLSLSILQFSPQVLTINVLSDFSGYFMEAFKQSDPDSAGAMGLGYNQNDNIKLAQ